MAHSTRNPHDHRAEDVLPGSPALPLSAKALNVYLQEYEQCLQGYRDIYETIWQAASFFAAVSAGVLAFAPKSNVFPIWFVGATLPLFAWWWLLFTPTDHFANDIYQARAREIEKRVSDSTVGAEMRLCTYFGSRDKALRDSKDKPESYQPLRCPRDVNNRVCAVMCIIALVDLGFLSFFAVNVAVPFLSDQLFHWPNPLAHLAAGLHQSG